MSIIHADVARSIINHPQNYQKWGGIEYRQVEDKGSKIWMSAAFLVGLTMVDPMNFAKQI